MFSIPIIRAGGDDELPVPVVYPVHRVAEPPVALRIVLEERQLVLTRIRQRVDGDGHVGDRLPGLLAVEGEPGLSVDILASVERAADLLALSPVGVVVVHSSDVDPVDSGKIQWLLQQETIKEISNIDWVFLLGDNAIVLSVETSQANQFKRDHIQVVTRGMRSKSLKGWQPNPVPQGYFNDRLTATIVSDPRRTAILRQAWELLLSGAYSVPSILRIMNDDWQYLTPRGNKLTLGGLVQDVPQPFLCWLVFFCRNPDQGQPRSDHHHG